MAETAEQVIGTTLEQHPAIDGFDEVGRWFNYACRCGWSSDADQADDYRAHVAAEVADALREGGVIVAGETVTEWGYRAHDGLPIWSSHAYVKWTARSHVENYLYRLNALGMRLITRQRTRYPDRVTDWQPVDGDA